MPAAGSAEPPPLPWWARVQEHPPQGALLVLGMTLAHAVAHALLGLPFGAAGFAALFVVPVALAGWCFGVASGLAFALAGVPLHLALDAPLGEGMVAVLSPPSLAQQAAFLFVGGISGGVGRLQRSLRQERDRSARLLENANAIVVVLDADGRVANVNGQAAEFLGVPRERLLGQPWFGRFAPARRAEDLAAAFLAHAGEGLAHAETPVVTARGEERVVLWRVSEHRDARGGRGLVGFGLDVTDRLRLEQEAAAQREAVHRNERLSALGTLVAGVAHEINNPLTYLQGNVELALLDLEEAERTLADAGAAVDFTQTRHGLQSALGGAERISQIAKALKAVARQRGAHEREPVDLGSVLRNVEALVRVGVPDGVDLRFETPQAPLVVSGNASELHQVILNLASNALDAVKERGGRVVVALRALDGRAEMSVQDDGVGIPPEVLPRIFTPFFTTKPSGTGLGLPIVHTIVQEHGGEIRVESSPGRGTTFRVALPRAHSMAGAADPERPPAAGRPLM